MAVALEESYLNTNFGRKTVGSKLQAIPGREHEIGGIEALKLDGEWLYFAFSFRADLVLSPLFTDEKQMILFASKFVGQMDGYHDEDYWGEHIEWARDESELTGDDESRTFTTSELAQYPVRLEEMVKSNKPDPDVEVEYHLRYLLGAASHAGMGWLEDSEAAERLGLDELGSVYGEMDNLYLIARGKRDLPAGANYADVASIIQGFFNILIEEAPANWPSYFGVLANPPVK